jgi:hypothetical protein
LNDLVELEKNVAVVAMPLLPPPSLPFGANPNSQLYYLAPSGLMTKPNFPNPAMFTANPHALYPSTQDFPTMPSTSSAPSSKLGKRKVAPSCDPLANEPWLQLNDMEPYLQKPKLEKEPTSITA